MAEKQKAAYEEVGRKRKRKSNRYEQIEAELIDCNGDILKKRGATNAYLMEKYAKHYACKSFQNRCYKAFFFWGTVGATGALIAAFAAVAIILSIKGISDNTQAGIVITAIGSALVALIALPLVIANYLFPKDEDKDLLGYMKAMEDNDMKQRQFSAEEALEIVSDKRIENIEQNPPQFHDIT